MIIQNTPTDFFNLPLLSPINLKISDKAMKALLPAASAVSAIHFYLPATILTYYFFFQLLPPFFIK
jgi:hypothetical protein